MEMEGGSVRGIWMCWGKQRGMVWENERKRVSESQCQRECGIREELPCGEGD